MSTEEEKALFEGDEQVLKKIIEENRFSICGDSYIPDVIVERYNEVYGMHYPIRDVDFDV